MKKSHRVILGIAAAGAVATPLALTMPSATADAGDAFAQLRPVALNGVHGGGSALVEVHGTRIDVTMGAYGLFPDFPHAAHIHFGAQARHECPTAMDDTDGSGTLTTTEGGPAYGPVVVSLTKTGDTSPASTLAIDRYDTAPGGDLQYARGHIKVTQVVARAITDGKAVIVIPGADDNGDGTIDGPASDLAPSLPSEATDPALCGALVPQA